MLRGEEQGATVSGIDVKPCIGGRSKFGNFGERIDGTKVRSSCGGDDGHRHETLISKDSEGVAEGRKAHAEVIVNFYSNDRMGAEAELRSGLLHCEVSDVGAENP